MTHVKRFSVLLLHLCASGFAQLSLLRLLLKENDPTVGIVLWRLLPAAAVCILDLSLSLLLLQRTTMGRYASIALHFWDVLLCCPVLVLAFFGLLSGGNGNVFAAGVLLLDLLLVIERSVVFVATDPSRKK